MPGSSIHKSEIEFKVPFSIQKVAHPSGTNLQLAAETCEFVQISLF